MQHYTQRYLEHLCDTVTARYPAAFTDPGSRAAYHDAGVEPFGIGAAMRFSPTRTKAVMRELLQHNLLTIAAVLGDDGRYELRMTPNRETARWYARVLRARAAQRRSAPPASPAPREPSGMAPRAARDTHSVVRATSG